ncbi:MAG: folate family ECF transporter S component [Tissierellaceae bacterium]
MKTRNRMSIKTIAISGVLVALSIVLTRFLAFMPTSTLRLGFGEVPIMLSGFLFGPMTGGITGIAADFVGLAINAQGTPHLGFTISSMLWGMIPGIFTNILKKVKVDNPYSSFNIIVVVSICFLSISLVLNTYWLSQLHGRGFFIVLPERVLSSIVNIPVQSIILISILKSLRKNLNI